MRHVTRRMWMTTTVVGALVVAASIAAASSLLSPASARATTTAAGFTNTVFANASTIKHATATGTEAVSQPDDITHLSGHVFVGFQNGVGPQGQASTTGNLDSTVVEFDRRGHVVRQWNLKGKCDGLGADPLTGRVIATVNEDAHSSLYTIDPSTAAPTHYRYNRALPSDGGTDAIEVYHGMILISASAPGTSGSAAPSARFPAAYKVVLRSGSHVAAVSSLFGDEAPATVANTNHDHGQRVHLALTDPDSNEVVPTYAHRFGGQFMLTSQADMEQIFVSHAGTAAQSVSVLKLTDSVDDTAWASDSTGAIYTTDNGNDTINKITGPFVRGSVYVAATPCDAATAPSTCPGPGFPANYLGQLNPDTGAITQLAVGGPAVTPQGMLFMP